MITFSQFPHAIHVNEEKKKQVKSDFLQCLGLCQVTGVELTVVIH